ncbi:monocarboxylate transporter 12-like [Asterias rubens]|uniref:monocarboxylate transporter 12-like n=1 Tax=Asterias rubens TaxID=7604 RepID=UPI0014556C59|nr:monocarboxylate transporter 12-like [Asterias rubens]XP_033626187.1 monocarboxylate transporter 12-like [Asterias rubens]
MGALVRECGHWGFAVVFASFTIHLLVMFASTRCAGVLFLSFQNEFQSTTAQTSAIFSIMYSSSYIGDMTGAVLGNHMGYRSTAILGGILNTAGMIGGSFTTRIYQMYFTNALAGIGAGITLMPAIVMVAKYFKTYYPLACGISSSGADIGMLVFGPLMQLLLDTYGWRGTMLVTGAIVGNLLAAGALFRPVRLSPSKTCNKKDTDVEHSGEDKEMLQDSREENHKSTQSEDHGISEVMNQRQSQSNNATNVTLKSQRQKRNLFSAVANLLWFYLLRDSYRLSMIIFTQVVAYRIAFNCFIMFLVPCATTSGISEQDASFLLSVCGIGGIVGRLICGVLTQKASSYAIYQVSMFVSGCAVLLVQFGTTWIYISASMIGITYGIQYTIWRVMMLEIVGVDNMGSAIGIYSCIGLPFSLTMPILSGALYDTTERYSTMFYIFAGFYFLGFAAMFLAPVLKRIEPGIFKKEDIK